MFPRSVGKDVMLDLSRASEFKFGEVSSVIGAMIVSGHDTCLFSGVSAFRPPLRRERQSTCSARRAGTFKTLLPTLHQGREALPYTTWAAVGL